MGPTTIFWLLYCFYLVQTLWDLYLSWRQYQLYRRTTVRPANVAEIISEEDFSKARAYKLDKFHFGFFTSAVNFAIYSVIGILTIKFSNSIFLRFYFWSHYSRGFGGSVHAWRCSFGLGAVRQVLQVKIINVPNLQIWKSVVYFIICSVSETLFSLPLTFYDTFYIEQKHGFNKEVFAVFSSFLQLFLLCV